MATRIIIDSTAFNAGKPLEQFAATKRAARVVVGQSDNNSNINGAGLGIKYIDPYLDRTVSRASITATIHPIDLDDVQVDRWPQYFKNSLADLVAKGVLVVERPVATPLTPAAIRAL